jgi:hypothetical protein
MIKLHSTFRRCRCLLASLAASAALAQTPQAPAQHRPRPS